MIGMTLCSGIGAPEVAAPWIDWRCASEIEDFPRAVLRHRFGYCPPEAHAPGAPLLWGDMTEITPDLLRARGVPLPDIVVAGTPCQAFSIAGARGGLADARGNLTLSFVEIVHAIVDARADGRLAVLWENVPGVLSDRTNAFGCFLGGLVGARDAVACRGSWPGAGLVAGPRGRAAWRVLGAEHFGVPQRRDRVFVVADFGDACDPAAVLFERKGVPGDSAPGGDARQDAGPDAARGARGGGGVTATNCGDVAPTLRAEGFDASEDGTGRRALIASHGAQDPDASGDVSHPLGRNGGLECCFAIQERATSENPSSGPQGSGVRADCAFTLEARHRPQAVAFAKNSRGELRLEGGAGHVTGALSSGGGKPGQGCPTIVSPPASIRRITPRDAERLQGFPDDHTRIPGARRVWHREIEEMREYLDPEGALSDDEIARLAADGPRYRALGNSMAVPVIAWLLRRMAGAMAQGSENAGKSL